MRPQTAKGIGSSSQTRLENPGFQSKMQQPTKQPVLTASAKKRFASPEPQMNEPFKPMVNKKSEQMLKNRG